MARNRVIYQSEAVFVSKNINSSGAAAHSQLRRIQSANYNYSVQRTDVNQYANLARIDAIVIEQPVVNLELTYLIGDGFNEKALGFTLEKDYDAQFGKEIFNSSFSGQNFYITTVEEGLDANLLTESAITSALANNNTSVIGIGNGYITNYSADFTVGALAIASVSIEASNIMSTGNLPRKSIYEEGYTGIPIASINPSDGVKKTEKISLDFANAGLTDGVSALRPGDVTVTIANSGIASNTFAVQSAKIAFPMSRESISKVGSKFAVAKVATFPIVSTITISATLGDLQARNLADQIDSTNTTDITLTVKGGSDNQEKISYRLKKCKLDSESFSASIGSNKTVELTFSTQIGGSNDSTNGIFVNGDSEESPFEFYLEAYNNMPAALRDGAFYFATYDDAQSTVGAADGQYTFQIVSTSSSNHPYRVYNSNGTLLETKNSGSTFTSTSQKGLKVFAVVHMDSVNPSQASNNISFSYYVVDVYGLKFFNTVNADGNNIKNLELITGPETSNPLLTTMINLLILNNSLTSLNLSRFSALAVVNCMSNKLKSFVPPSSATTINCGYNQLTNLNLSSCNSLNSAYCEYNELVNLSVPSSCSTLYCNNNLLSSLALPADSQTIKCHNNQLTTLYLGDIFDGGNGPNVLTTLACYSNKLASLNFEGLTTLQSFDCADNKLTNLNLLGLDSLTNVVLRDNKLTGLTPPSTMSYCSSFSIADCGLPITPLNTSLQKLANNSISNGFLNIAGNAAYNNITSGHLSVLSGRYWTIVK